MSSSPLLKAKRKICCCFTVDDSEEDDNSTIHLQRVESDISPSVLEPGIYTSKKFAANKIYCLKCEGRTMLACFRHLVLDIDEEPASTLDRPDQVPEDFWKERYKFFSKYDQGIHLEQDSYNFEVQEKVAKHLAKFINERAKVNCCVVYPCGASSLPLQLAKTVKVKVLENNERKRSCLKENAEIYEVSENIEFFVGDLENMRREQGGEEEGEDREDLQDTKDNVLVICPQIDRKAQVKIWMQAGYLPELIESSLKIYQNIAVLFPPTLDPYEFVECLRYESLEPLVEFIMLFDRSHLKNIACLLGNFTKFDTPDIIRSISSKLGMDKRQNDFIEGVLRNLGLRRLLEILDMAEASSDKGSLLEKIRSKSRKFIDILKEEEEISLDRIIVLYKGSDGDEIARLLEQASLFFVEVESDGQTYIEINTTRYEGLNDISLYIEGEKAKETPNKNSLFQLIGY